MSKFPRDEKRILAVSKFPISLNLRAFNWMPVEQSFCSHENVELLELQPTLSSDRIESNQYVVSLLGASLSSRLYPVSEYSVDD